MKLKIKTTSRDLKSAMSDAWGDAASIDTKLYNVESDHGMIRGVDEANNDWHEIPVASPYWGCHRCGETFEKWLFLCIQSGQEICGKHIYIDDDGPVSG